MALNKLRWLGRWQCNPDIPACLTLIGLGILFFGDFLFSSKNFFFRDILNFHYPLRKVLIDSYARGELPLWNPYIYLGQPLLANPNYMAFYPTNLFHLFMPFNYAFKLHFIIHPIFAGLGAYLLMRRLGIGALAAFTGSLAYEFSGTVLSFLNLYNLVPAVALLPWIGWAFYGALQDKWLRRSLGFGALLGLQTMAFEPLLFQCVLWLLLGLAGLYLLQMENKPRAAGTVLRAGLLGGCFGLGLAAIQVIPTLELLPLSARGNLEYVEVSSWSLHPLDLVSTFIPNLFGNYYTIGRATWWGGSIHHGREGYLVSLFLGSCTLLLAALSFASGRRTLRLILLCQALVTAFLALGRYNPAYPWLCENIPLFSWGRYPSKYFLLSTLVLCIMASLGAEVLFKQDKTGARQRLAVAICGLLVAGAFLACWIYSGTHSGIIESWLRNEANSRDLPKDFAALVEHLRQSFFSSSLFLALASSVILILNVPRLEKKLLLKVLLPVLIAAELIPANLRLSPLISDADINFVPEVNRFLGQQSSEEPFRVASPTILKANDSLPRLSLYTPNHSSAWLTLFYKMSGQAFYGTLNGIQYSIDRSVDGLNTRESELLWKAYSQLPMDSAYSLFRKLNSSAILSMGEIKDDRLTPLSSFDTRSNIPVHAYWLSDTLKRAYFVSGSHYVDSQPKAFKEFLYPDFPAGNIAVLEGSVESKRIGNGRGTVKLVHYGNSRVVCEVNAEVSGHVILLDSYYPGWKVLLDGKETQVLRANYAFRAVHVPPGTHTVEFVYKPVSFYAGLGVTSITLTVGIGILVLARRRLSGAEKEKGGS